jgi:hypothetical protein
MSKKRGPTKTIFVVYQASMDEEGNPTMSGAIAGFPTHEQAEEYARQHNMKSQLYYNPFRHGPIDFSNFAAGGRRAIDKTLKTLGLSLPPAKLEKSPYGGGKVDVTNYAAWWAENIAPLSDEQKAIVWSAFDALNSNYFYDITELPLED